MMFLSTVRADGGDSGDRSPWGDFWFSPVPFRAGSHQAIGGDQAMRLTAVYACVRVLAESIAMLPFVLYSEAADGAKTPNKNHWLYKLFAVRPNDYQNPLEFREMLQGHLALRGNAFARIYSDRSGVVTDLIPLNPDQITIEMLSETNWRYRYRNRDNTETILNRGDVFHLRGLSPDGIVGYNPIEAARESITTGLAAQDYGMRYFENDATPGGWIEFPGQFKTDEQRNLWREQFQRSQTGRHRHKTAVLELGMKYHTIQVTNADAQYLETRKYSVTDIARLFRIPPHLIGDLDRATFANIEQQSLEFVLYTLMPWLTRWEAAIRYTFLEPEDGLNVEFPAKALQRGDAGARAAYYHNGILDGWMTRNEARLAESMNPLDGLDEPLRPLNMVEESEAEKNENEPTEQQPATPAQVPAGPPNKPPNNAPGVPKVPKAEADMRLFQLARANAERIARKETAMVQAALRASSPAEAITDAYEKHVSFVEQALSVPHEQAVEYCLQRVDFLQTQGPSIEIELFNDSACMQLTRLALEGAL